MKLYKINGNYPDQDFAFTIQASDIGLAPSVHAHAIADINELTTALSGKSSTGHTHTCVETLYSAVPASGETLVGISISATGINVATASINGSIITLAYDSPETGRALGIIEHNTEAKYTIVQVFGGELYDTDSEDTSFLVMEGNTNA